MSKKGIMITCILIFCVVFFIGWTIQSSEKQLFVEISFDNFVIDGTGNQKLLSQWDAFIAKSEAGISQIEIDIQTSTGLYLYGGGKVFEDDAYPTSLTAAVQGYSDTDMIYQSYTEENKQRVLKSLVVMIDSIGYQNLHSLIQKSNGIMRNRKYGVKSKHSVSKDLFVHSETFFSNALCINEQTEVKVRASTNTDWSKDSLMVVYDEKRMISQMRYDLRLFERDISLVELFCESIDQKSGVKKVEPMQGIGYANLSQYLFINNNEKDKYLPLIRRVLLAMKNNDLALLQRESVYNQENIFSFFPFPHLQDLRQGVQFDNKIIGKASMSSMSDNYLVDYRISLSGEYLILDISNPQVKIFDSNTYTFYTGYISLELNNVFYDQ